MLSFLTISTTADRWWFDGNMLNGSLPVELTEASTLGESVFLMSSSALSLAFLIRDVSTVNVVGLFLSRNQISGSLPSEIGKWTNLSKYEVTVSIVIVSGASKLFS